MTRNRPIPHLSDTDKTYIRDLVIYEDQYMLAFNKPSGLPSQVRGNRGRNLDHLLWAFAKSNGKRPRLVHRLDSGTSGVIVAGRTKPAAAALSGAFESRDVKKSYVALVSGAVPPGDEGTFKARISRVDDDRGSKIIAGMKNGKEAVTDWRVAARWDGYALMLLFPRTGRMHQLRVHLAHAGCPILGDHIYGEKTNAPRLMLHAESLRFPHPETSEMMTLEAELPEVFRKVMVAKGWSD